MTDAAESPEVFAEGPCEGCRAETVLMRGGLTSQLLCPTCTFWHARAPEVLAELKRRRLGVVTIEGKKIRVASSRAVLMIAQQLAAKWRREQAEKQTTLASAQAEA
jgi:hypothetical protein